MTHGGRLLLHSAAVAGILFSPGGLATHASAAGESEIKPPFNLTWGETADRLERLVVGAGGKVTSRKRVRGDREAIEVAGLPQEGLKKTIFYFKQGVLVAVELQYQSDEWPESKYNKMMGDLRQRISEHYGEGQQIARRQEQVGVNGVTQTVTGYKWVSGSSNVQLIYFAATDSSNSFRVLSVHYNS